jgi:hypothetical protein
VDKYISPQEFVEEMTKRPDVNEIMKHLAESGWDDPAVYLDTPYFTNEDKDRSDPQRQQPDEGEHS